MKETMLRVAIRVLSDECGSSPWGGGAGSAAAAAGVIVRRYVIGVR